MSTIKNAAVAIVPLRERREAAGILAALNAELVIDLNGDESALVYVQSTAFIGTLEFTGCNNDDETQFFPVVAYPYSTGCAGGTIPPAGQPLLLDPLIAANTSRVYSVPVGQLRKLRVRASAFTSGGCYVSITSDTQDELNTAIAAKPTTLLGTNTALVGVAVTLSLPAVAGLRHILDFITVDRHGTAALTSAATPVLVTTTNLPGALAIGFGADAGGVGIDKSITRDFGASGLAASVLGTATTIVCPAYVGVIWRVTAGYRLGL